MVEQTLTAHPQIAAGDELPIINELTALMPRMLAARSPIPRRWPSSGSATSSKASTICATIICSAPASSARCSRAQPWFTDKMPLNETHLGLIGLIFPAARRSSI